MEKCDFRPNYGLLSRFRPATWAQGALIRSRDPGAYVAGPLAPRVIAPHGLRPRACGLASAPPTRGNPYLHRPLGARDNSDGLYSWPVTWAQGALTRSRDPGAYVAGPLASRSDCVAEVSQ